MRGFAHILDTSRRSDAMFSISFAYCDAPHSMGTSIGPTDELQAITFAVRASIKWVGALHHDVRAKSSACAERDTCDHPAHLLAGTRHTHTLYPQCSGTDLPKYGLYNRSSKRVHTSFVFQRGRTMAPSSVQRATQSPLRLHDMLV